MHRDLLMIILIIEISISQNIDVAQFGACVCACVCVLVPQTQNHHSQNWRQQRHSRPPGNNAIYEDNSTQNRSFPTQLFSLYSKKCYAWFI